MTAAPTPSHPPAHLERHWTAPDGTTLVIRPIVGDDEPFEQAFVDSLSRDTSYRRLFSGRTPQRDEIARWTHIDYDREMAFVAIDPRAEPPRMCGVARYVREAGDAAAFAIVLADDWQHRGLGTALMRALIDAARAAGIATLSDVTMADNLSMLSLVRRLGFRVASEAGDATLRRITLDLRDPD